MVATARIVAANGSFNHIRQMASMYPRVIHGSLDSRESAVQTACRSVQPFLQLRLILVTNTQTGTETTLRQHMRRNSPIYSTPCC